MFVKLAREQAIKIREPNKCSLKMYITSHPLLNLTVFYLKLWLLRKKNSHLKNFRITLRVRKLLLLIPTDPAIQEALDQLDSLGRKV